MRHLSLCSSFSKWAPPLRLLGLLIGLFGFMQITIDSDPAGIVVGVIGSLVWQAGMLVEECSPPRFRILSTTTACDAMRSERIDIPGWWRVVTVHERFPTLSDQAFFVVIQDGYESGIALPEQLAEVRADDARYLPVAQIAKAISYVDAIRDDTLLLSAFSALEQRRRDYVPVLDAREHIVGVVTRKELADVLDETAVVSGRVDVIEPIHHSSATALAPNTSPK
jgi:hypothetical protein